MGKILEEGEYILPDDLMLEKAGKYVTVRRKLLPKLDAIRCKKCRYFGFGAATNTTWETTVCLLQPKNRVTKEGKPIYYHISSRQVKCEKFEEK